MSSSKHFQVAIDPGEKYFLFSQSALDELIDNHVKAEREACAKLCDDIDAEYHGEEVLATWCSNRIRARGQQ